jgi:hypothetical protein
MARSSGASSCAANPAPAAAPGRAARTSFAARKIKT